MSVSPKKSFTDRFMVRDCNTASNRIRTITYVVVFITIILVGLFIGFLYIGASCVVRFHFDSDQFESRGIQITPTQPIIVDFTGRKADTTNATFKVNQIIIGSITQKLNRVFGREVYYFQVVTGRRVSDELDSILPEINNQTDVFMGGMIFFINSTNPNNTQPRDMTMRLSADYQISIKMVMLVDFNDPNEVDSYISFYYIKNFGTVDTFGRPNGELPIQLKRFTILDITIKNITILYPKMEKFFSTWNTESDITSYPYILDLNLNYETSFDFFNNNYNK